MTREHDLQQVTDWASPLEKVYVRQSQQLEEHHRNLRDQLEQKEQADLSGWMSTKTLNSILEFAPIAAEQFKKSNKKREDKLNLKAQRDYDEYGMESEKHEKYLLEIKDIDRGSIKYQQFITETAEREEWSDSQLNYYRNLHGRNLVAENRRLTASMTVQMPTSFRGALDADPDKHLKYSAAKQPERERMYRNFAMDRLGKFTGEEYNQATHFKTFATQAKTQAVLADLPVKEKNLTAKTIELNNDLKAAAISDIPDALTTELQTQIMTGIGVGGVQNIVDSRENVTNRLERLALTKNLTLNQLRTMKNGKLPIPYAAGKTGDLLLTEDQWQRIEQSIIKADEDSITNYKNNVEAIGNSAIVKLHAGNGTLEELTQLKADTLRLYRTTFGENDKRVKELEAKDPTAQLPEARAKAVEKYESTFNGTDIGKVLHREDTFKEEQNVKVRDKLADIVKEAKTTLRAAKLPDTLSKYETSIKDEMLTSPAQKRNLKRDKVLSPNSSRVQTELAQKKLEFLMTAVRNGESTDIGIKNWEQYLDDNGFNVYDTDPNAGRYSPDIHGEYPAFQFITEAERENRTESSLRKRVQWRQRANNQLDKYDRNIEVMLNEPESYIEKEDVLGAFISPSEAYPVKSQENPETNQKEYSDVQLYYSPELIEKALTIRRQPGYVLKKSLEALIKDKEYKNYVDRFDLKGKLEILNNAPDLKLKEIIDELGDPKLITKYNISGLRSFTRKDLERLMNLEIAMNVPIVEK